MMKASPLLAAAANVVFPARCLVCKEYVADHGALCAACWREMHFITDPMCRHCGLPFEYTLGEHGLCGRCIAEPPAFTRACSVFRYDDKSRSQMIGFKFHDRTQLAPLFGQWLAHSAAKEFLPVSDVIIPVPLHYWRLLSRRYNQASLLAYALAKQCHLPVLSHVLQRKRATPAQSGLSRAGRENNVRGAFRVPKKQRAQVRGKTVLLVDDVMTTGATLSACARALRAAGVRDVYVVTVARTVIGE